MDKRTLARRGFVFLIFSSIFHDSIGDEYIDLFIDNFEYSDVKKSILDYYNDYRLKIDEVDEKISENLKNWSIDRLHKLDLSILRVGVYEVFFKDSVPNEVAVNEAVEFAKIYSSEDSSKLINGILGTIIRSLK